MANPDRVRGNDIGPTGVTVGRNIARIRKSQQVSLQALESLLDALGRRISLSGLSKIENGDRRVDADDLMAIAIALDVSPVALLLPVDEPSSIVDVTGARGSVALFWQWAFADHTHFSRDDRAFVARSLPWWLDTDASIKWYGNLDLSLAREDGVLSVVETQTFRAESATEVELSRDPEPRARDWSIHFAADDVEMSGGLVDLERMVDEASPPAASATEGRDRGEHQAEA